MNKYKFIGNIMLVIGLACFSFGIIFGLIVPKSFKNNSTEVIGTITDINSENTTYRASDGKMKRRTDYTVYVEYYLGDEKYSSHINSYSSSMHIGEDIKLYVKNDNPYNVEYLSINYILGGVFSAFGLIFIIGAVIFLNISSRSKKKVKSLLSEGLKVQAKVIGIEPDRSIVINGRHPFYYICEDSNGRIYTSDSYTDKKTGGFPLSINTIVTVYYDSSDASNYYVDILSSI